MQYIYGVDDFVGVNLVRFTSCGTVPPHSNNIKLRNMGARQLSVKFGFDFANEKSPMD